LKRSTTSFRKRLPCFCSVCIRILHAAILVGVGQLQLSCEGRRRSTICRTQGIPHVGVEFLLSYPKLALLLAALFSSNADN